MNAIDYAIFRGDLSFDISPLNEVDALIFSLVAYYRIEELRNEGIDVMDKTLGEIIALHKEKFPQVSKMASAFQVEKDITPDKFIPHLMLQLEETDRFSKVIVRDFKDVFDEQLTVQFAAYTFELSNGERVVSFRGTDDTTIGWKEDCMMSYLPEIPGQVEAARYADAIEDGYRYYITGHSKGGNEAMYAFLNMEESKVKNIVGVYNFDGPGFIADVFDMPRYVNHKGIIHTFIPSSSVVGMLLEHTKDYSVVKSQKIGVWQHNALFWQVRCTKFEIETGKEWKRQVSEDTFAKFLSGLSVAERQNVTESVFSVLDRSGVKRFSQFSQTPKIIAPVMGKLMMLPGEEKHRLRGALIDLYSAWTSSYFPELAGHLPKPKIVKKGGPIMQYLRKKKN